MNKNLKLLFLHRFVYLIAIKILGIFSIFYFYEILGESFTKLMLIYALYAFLIAFINIFIGKVLNKIGFKKINIFGIFLNVIFWSMLLLAGKYQSEIILVLAFMIRSVSAVFYWTPYHTFFAKHSEKGKKTKAVMTVNIITNSLSLVSPITVGFIASKYSMAPVFLMAIMFAILSMIPVFKSKEINNIFQWDTKKIFKRIFKKKNINYSKAQFFRGIADTVKLVAWPIFIFHLLKGDYLKIGLILSLTYLLVIIISYFLGKIDKKKELRKKILKYGDFAYAAGWIFKIFSTNAFSIFIFDTYHRFVSTFSRPIFDTLAYEHISEKEQLIDERVVIKEIALNIGRFSGYIILALIYFFSSSFTPIFILAAIALLISDRYILKT